MGASKGRGQLPPPLATRSRLMWPALLPLALLAAVCLPAAALVPPPAAGQPINPEWVPQLAEVTSVRLGFPVPTPPAESPLPLYATHPAHRPMIALVLDLLADSRLAAGEITPSRKGTALMIALRSGRPVSVHPAQDCQKLARETGHGYTCRPSPDQLILLTREGRPVRLHNPRMAEWLRSGWKADQPVGEPTDMDRETAVALAREQSRLPEWQASFVEEYPVERLGETEVRRAWVLEAELPAGQKIRLVLDARTGEVLRLVQLEAMQ